MGCNLAGSSFSRASAIAFTTAIIPAVHRVSRVCAVRSHMPHVHIAWLPKACRTPAVRKEVADAVIKAMTAVKSADVAPDKLVVRFSESVDVRRVHIRHDCLFYPVSFYPSRYVHFCRASRCQRASATALTCRHHKRSEPFARARTLGPVPHLAGVNL